MSYYVYLIESLKDNSYYIGVTDNINRRFKEHNSGQSKYTKNKVPWKLIGYKQYNEINQAYQQEKKLKKAKKRNVIEKFFNII